MTDETPKEPSLPPDAPPGARWIACDLCGYRTLELHCKIRCLQCGATRDCSDL